MGRIQFNLLSFIEQTKWKNFLSFITFTFPMKDPLDSHSVEFFSTNLLLFELQLFETKFNSSSRWFIASNLHIFHYCSSFPRVSRQLFFFFLVYWFSIANTLNSRTVGVPYQNKMFVLKRHFKNEWEKKKNERQRDAEGK